MSTNPLPHTSNATTASSSSSNKEPRSSLVLDKESLHGQLVLEQQLQTISGQLIDLYKSNRQWIEVGEIANTLNSNSLRISTINGLLNDNPMEEKGDDTISVILNNNDENSSPKWIINTGNNNSVTRTLEDINQLKTHLETTYTLTITSSTDTVGQSLQQLLVLALRDKVIKSDHILACFLTDKIEDFSIVMCKEGKEEDEVTTTNDGPIHHDSSTTQQDVPSSKEDEIPTMKEDGLPIIQEDKLNTSSSGMSIGEYDCSPQVPKRQNSLPVTDPGSSPQSPPPLSPQSPLATTNKPPESSSEEGSSVNIEGGEQGGGGRTTSESDTNTATAPNKLVTKGRSKSLFYDSEEATKISGVSMNNKKKGNSKSVKKGKIKVEDTASKVTLATPNLAVDWDPTCLLEELYNDCQPGAGQSSSGENSRHSGYLGKLPVNQRKPNVLKGWKHRFFRLTRGSLFYYEAENSTKAISFIRLSDSKIVQHNETLKLEIIEKGGNFIMLRAESREEMYTWNRALQLEAVHPTMTHRLSLSPGRSDCVIIVDLGACSVRAGITNDNNYPQMFFPTICAVDDDKVIACGNEALLPGVRTSAKLIYPCRRRLRLDSTLPVRECFQSIFEKICKTLRVEPQNTSVLVCVSPVMPEQEQVTLCEVLLEVLNFKSILIQEQTTMALYSYNHTSGIVVNIGDSTDVVPIIDGFKVNSGTSHSPFGGHSITESLSKLATSHGIRYFSEAEMYIVRYIKESICFLSQDYPTDCVQCEESPLDYKRAVDVDRFQLSDHRKLIHLDSALFTATEGIFNPGVWGKDNTGLHEMVQKAIEQCPIDMRRQIVRHIYLAGGTTLLVGLQERLQKELECMYPRLEIQVHGSDNRHHASFLGAGVLASLNSFTRSLVDLDNWSANGLEAMKHNQT